MSDIMQVKKEKAFELYKKGMPLMKISKEVGLTVSGVQSCIRQYYVKCKTCQYRGTSVYQCNYLDVVGHRRPCSAENCTEYVEGAKIDKNPYDYFKCGKNVEWNPDPKLYYSQEVIEEYKGEE